MGEISQYFGNDTMKLFLDNASENIKTFNSKNPATKLDLVDDLYTKNEIYKQAVPELIETLDEVEADRDLKAKIIKQMEEDFGIIDDAYIRKHKLLVVMTDERKYARKALISHINNKYKTQIPLQSSQHKVTK